MTCVIIGAAPIKNYKKIRTYLHKDDFVIACDAGLNHLKKLRLKPKLIVGDFDSHKKPNSSVETIVLPREKDDTDSVFALKTAISRGFSHFIFLGMTGNRLDHTLGNLSLLLRCHEKNLSATMLDDFSEIQLVGKKEVEISDSFQYFSLLTISGSASGVTVKNAKFPLENAVLTPENNQLGVSNEILPGKKALVSVQNGLLLLVKCHYETKRN